MFRACTDTVIGVIKWEFFLANYAENRGGDGPGTRTACDMVAAEAENMLTVYFGPFAPLVSFLSPSCSEIEMHPARVQVLYASGSAGGLCRNSRTNQVVAGSLNLCHCNCKTVFCVCINFTVSITGATHQFAMSGAVE